MDIPLHYFDEFIGDSFYGSLSNPFSSLSSKLGPLCASSLNATLASGSNCLLPPTTTLPPVLSSTLSYLAELPAPSTWGRDHILRQCISLYGITYVGIVLLYFGVATLSYFCIFDHRMMAHPRFLKNQVAKEIRFSLDAFPLLDLFTLPWFVGDVRGHSMLFDTMAEAPWQSLGAWGPWAYIALSSALFLWFTDFAIYWVHRWLHIPFLYKRIHKPHHKWIVPTPFASHAFDPVDGYLQSVPYHMACYMFPIHKYQFMALFSFVNLWSIFIHDSDMICDHPLEHYINGPAHHTLHHLYFTCNYGQYFTWADKYFGSFRVPAKEDDPLLIILAAQKAKEGGAEIKPELEDKVEQLTIKKTK